VVLPLVLHPPTLAILPGRADITFATWSADNEALLAELPERILRLRPISREAHGGRFHQASANEPVRRHLAKNQRRIQATSGAVLI
jgi:hypothetical protein